MYVTQNVSISLVQSDQHHHDVHHQHDHHCNDHLGNWEAVESHPTSQGRLWRDRCSQRGHFFSPVCQNIIRIGWRINHYNQAARRDATFSPCVRTILNHWMQIMLCWTSWWVGNISNLLLLIYKSCFDIVANFFHQISNNFKISNLSVGFSCSSLSARSTQTASSPPPYQWSASSTLSWSGWSPFLSWLSS